MNGWRDYWNRENRIYASARHLEAYYRVLGADVLSIVPSTRPLTILDWGCGEALLAPFLRDAGLAVLLYDPVLRAHERAEARYGGEPGITVLDARAYENLRDGSVDVILVHSVLQYLSKQEWEAVLPRLRSLLSPQGMLMLGDVVPTGISMFVDAYDLLSAGWKHGFFLDAARALVATLFSDYRSVRKASGFSTYAEGELIEILGRHGFAAKRAARNIGLSGHRMLILASLPNGSGPGILHP